MCRRGCLIDKGCSWGLTQSKIYLPRWPSEGLWVTLEGKAANRHKEKRDKGWQLALPLLTLCLSQGKGLHFSPQEGGCDKVTCLGGDLEANRPYVGTWLVQM